MNIFIPKHIREIGVVSKMCDLIDKYASESSVYNTENTENSFSDYYYYLKIDPVIRFLNIRISDSEWSENHPSEEYNSVIAYMSRLFYSVKGTYKVFDYMREYLGLKIEDLSYTVKQLNFTLREIELVDIDENVFYNSLIDFLRALLYFGESNIRIGVVKLELSNTIHNYIGANIVTYKEYTTVQYEGEV